METLKIHFFNVAEGDAILLEFCQESSTFRVLVDTGRSILPESPGSMRQTAARHLTKMGIDFIDILVITHFHVDHIQDLPEIMRTVRFGSIYSTWFPSNSTTRINDIISELKPVRELPRDLNTITECIRIADEAGTAKIPVIEDTLIPVPGCSGSIRIRMPKGDLLNFQNSVYDQLSSGAVVPEQDVYRAAKARNNNCLRLLIRYRGRTIALDGDYYAADAEREEQAPCDILKAAHHGDKKSMTEKLAAMLRPKYAVISCMREYDAKKDRPSKNTADLLRKYGSKIFYTDCFHEEGFPPEFHEEVLITVDENGKISVRS